MARFQAPKAILLTIFLGLGVGPTRGQEAESSSLGPSPGEGDAPGGNEGILGGRAGVSTPRVPASATRPGRGGTGLPESSAIRPPGEADRATLPVYGPLALPAETDDEGPAHGLTLDMAVERLVRENLELRSKFLEIPQAQADILTASLRANPVLFADAQLIPYQEYSRERPGGSTQYDVNITYPLDVNGKRRVRREVACRAKRVLEAQYQDAVRQQIDNLYTAYVDLLTARATVRFARASIAGLERLQGVTQALRRAGEVTLADVSHLEVERDSAEIGALEAEQALQDARRALVPLLNLSDAQAMTIEPRGSIFDRAAPPPPADELIRIALAERPDLIAYRLGLHRAEAGVKLARAERFSDIFVLVQPYTFQDNAPFHRKSAHSWALGVSVPLPIHDRNQGNIERARINVVQTRTELASLEQQVANEVRRAERRYAITRLAQMRIERSLLSAARRGRDDALANYRSGEANVVDYLNAEGDYNELVRQYRDTVIGHRRSMLALNTAVGRRLLP